jgi:nucleotide-binding universal stress UspA family protein
MPQKIIVGTDGSATAAKAVDRAVEVAQLSGASLTIASIGPEERARAVVAAELERLAGSGLTLDTLVATGEPAEGLVDAARSGGYDLLVTGNRGMTGITRFLRLGSVPNKITHHLPCSMLVVKTT